MRDHEDVGGPGYREAVLCKAARRLLLLLTGTTACLPVHADPLSVTATAWLDAGQTSLPSSVLEQTTTRTGASLESALEVLTDVLGQAPNNQTNYALSASAWGSVGDRTLHASAQGQLFAPYTGLLQGQVVAHVVTDFGALAKVSITDTFQITSASAAGQTLVVTFNRPHVDGTNAASVQGVVSSTIGTTFYAANAGAAVTLTQGTSAFGIATPANLGATVYGASGSPANQSSVKTFNGYPSGGSSSSGPGTWDVSLAQGQDVSIEFDMSANVGNAGLTPNWSSWRCLGFSCTLAGDAPGNAGKLDLSANFADTASWGGIQSVHLVDGTLVTDWQLVSQNGIDWTSASPVPEPASYGMVVAGVCLLVAKLRLGRSGQADNDRRGPAPTGSSA